MKRIRIQANKQCSKQYMPVTVGGNFCTKSCEFFTKQLHNRIYCNADEYVLDIDLNGGVYKVKRK